MWLDSIKDTPHGSTVKVEFYKASVTDWTELEKVFDVYAEKIGGVPYIVCPGAGIYEPVCSLFLVIIVLDPLRPGTIWSLPTADTLIMERLVTQRVLEG